MTIADDARLQLLTTLPGLFRSLVHVVGTDESVVELVAKVDRLDEVTIRDETLRGLGYERQDTERLVYRRRDEVEYVLRVSGRPPAGHRHRAEHEHGEDTDQR